MKTYDLAVIGTGTAAMVASMRVRSAGWSVAVIDDQPFGGTCALRGCDPKKMLIAGAEAIDDAGRMRGHGIEGRLEIDWPELMSFKRSFTDSIPGKHQHRYAEKGIDAFEAQALFSGPNTLDVAGHVVEARHILIAAGAEPVRLGIRGEEHLITSTDFLNLEELPRQIVLVGGGYIAAEFSHIASRAGSQVTIVQRGDRMLKQFDPDLVGWLMDAFRSSGIKVRLATRVEQIERTENGVRVHISDGDRTDVIEADVAVHAAGRSPALEKLNLNAANVSVEQGKLKLNEFLQSVSNPSVYAAGDAAQSGLPLTPVSSHDAKVVASNLLHGNHVKPDYRGVPSVAFTLPPIAAVGLSQTEAHDQGLHVRIKCARVSDWYTARRVAEPVYGYKTIVDENTDHLLGGHLVGPHVDEVINTFALAIRHGLTADDLKSTMFAYPTGASDIGYML